MDDNIFIILMISFFCIGFVAIAATWGIVLSKHSKFKDKIDKNSYSQYKNENPHLVSDGKVICKICGNSTIGIMPMFSPKNAEHVGNPDAIAHICNHCGTTLYYSKVDE